MLQGRRPYLVVAVVLLSIAALAVYQVLNSTAWIYYYRLTDDQTLMLGVTSGPGADVHLERLVEAPDRVTVTVIAVYISPPLPQTGLGYEYEVPAHLAQPLGNRLVVDGSSGRAVTRVACPPPAISAEPCIQPAATPFTDR